VLYGSRRKGPFGQHGAADGTSGRGIAAVCSSGTRAAPPVYGLNATLVLAGAKGGPIWPIFVNMPVAKGGKETNKGFLGFSGSCVCACVCVRVCVRVCVYVFSGDTDGRTVHKQVYETDKEAR
jgi:hypothetical protein